MLAVFFCLVVSFLLLVLTEVLGERRILKGEYRRKFLHIIGGSFIATWPWLISWHWIELIGLAMVGVMLTNRYIPFFNYHGRVHRATYGDYYFALAVTLTALLAHNKIFFALAILEVALADGLAAVTGIAYGKKWAYKVFGSKKTVVGSMVFWIASLCILGIGLLPAHNVISLQHYLILVILIPPAFTVAENISIYGLDNLVIPLLMVALLRIAQI